jgi:general secretion pathway protein I
MRFSSNHPLCRGARGDTGFTLLEVMVAVAVIAIAFVTLIGAQSQSVTIATSAKFDAQASLLAQRKMAELCLQNYGELNGGSGDFGTEHPSFFWKAEVTDLGEGDTGIKGVAGMLKAIDLTVSFEQDAAQLYVLRTIVFQKKNAVVK